MDGRYLWETPMLNYRANPIQRLIGRRNWEELGEFAKIQSIYNFVRDEIRFGYNIGDGVTAERVLRDGYGQCNTKGTLFMALLRAVGIPCRVHGFAIDKKLQKGAMTGLVYWSAPQNILHSWVEVFYQGQWRELEGFILDRAYLTALQERHKDCAGAFCGYGMAVKDFRSPPVDWTGGNTYIQSEGITCDFGVYDSPDELLHEHGQDMGMCKEAMYRYIGRHLMNRNVKRIRPAQGSVK